MLHIRSLSVVVGGDPVFRQSRSLQANCRYSRTQLPKELRKFKPSTKKSIPGPHIGMYNFNYSNDLVIQLRTRNFHIAVGNFGSHRGPFASKQP